MGIGTSPYSELYGDKGGIYSVRLIGNDLWWYAEDKGGTWAHIFKGSVSMLMTPKTIAGEWADIPKIKTITGAWVDITKTKKMSAGEVKLTIINDNEAKVSSQTGGFIDTVLKEAK